MRDGGAAVFVAENQEYVDKILPLADALPALRWILVIDDSAMFDYAHPKLKSFAAVLKVGDAAGAEALAPLAQALDPGAPAFIVYTSGTTGQPKGAVVGHAKHVAAAGNVLAHYPALAAREQRTVIYLPPCHILGRDIAITLPLLSRLVPHYGEDVEDLPQTLFEVAPTVLFTVPRYLQKFASQALIGIAASSRAKRLAYEAALGIGRRHARTRWERGTHFSLPYALARALVFRPLLSKLGLDEVELMVCGGAALPPDTLRSGRSG
jgi:long-chain acyl-CoA synthetase